MVIVQFLVVAAAFAVIDAVWLKLMNPFYRGQIEELLADKPHLGYAVVFYVMYIAGIVFFALRPALDGGSWPVGSPPHGACHAGGVVGLPLKLTHGGGFPRRAPSGG